MNNSSNNINKKKHKAVDGKNPKNIKRKGDWTEKKGCSVINYDPEHDTNFHDIDMKKYEKWNNQRIKEYEESKKLIEELKKYLPEDEISYGYREAVKIQRNEYPIFGLFYDFHKAANLKYASKYGDDETNVVKEYCGLKVMVERFLRVKKSEKKSSGVLDTLAGIDFSEVMEQIRNDD